MFMAELAGLCIEVDNKYPYVQELYSAYITERRDPSFRVSATDAQIASEGEGDAGYLESLALYRQIAENITSYGGFLMHGSVLDVNGTGIAFLAKSGVGKSTHTLLWLESFPDCRVINGDKPLIRRMDGRFYAYGTPHNGKENMGVNDRTEIKHICFIERAAANSVADCPDAFERLMRQIYIPKSPAALELFDTLDAFMRQMEFHIIRCNMDISAAQTARAEVFSK